jgi:hypothetical protein
MEPERRELFFSTDTDVGDSKAARSASVEGWQGRENRSMRTARKTTSGPYFLKKRFGEKRAYAHRLLAQQPSSTKGSIGGAMSKSCKPSNTCIPSPRSPPARAATVACSDDNDTSCTETMMNKETTTQAVCHHLGWWHGAPVASGKTQLALLVRHQGLIELDRGHDGLLVGRSKRVESTQLMHQLVDAVLVQDHGHAELCAAQRKRALSHRADEG